MRPEKRRARGGAPRPAARRAAGRPRPLAFTVETTWTGGIRTVTRARGHEVVADGPLWRHGTDDGPAPGELMLASVGACLVNHLARALERKRVAFQGLGSKVTGTFKRVDGLDVFDAFRFDVTVRAPEASRRPVERALEAARAECTLLLVVDVGKEFHLEFVPDEGDGDDGDA
jgi:uncharacterized OsmC-like protein